MNPDRDRIANPAGARTNPSGTADRRAPLRRRTRMSCPTSHSPGPAAPPVTAEAVEAVLSSDEAAALCCDDPDDRKMLAKLLAERLSGDVASWCDSSWTGCNFVVPVRTYSPNGPHGHWSKTSKRRKLERWTAGVSGRECGALEVGLQAALKKHGLEVTLTRIGPSCGLDDDNLAAALKGVRDGVADALGFSDDRDPLLHWHYGQRRGNDWSVEVLIERTKT